MNEEKDPTPKPEAVAIGDRLSGKLFDGAGTHFELGKIRDDMEELRPAAHFLVLNVDPEPERRGAIDQLENMGTLGRAPRHIPTFASTGADIWIQPTSFAYILVIDEGRTTD